MLFRKFLLLLSALVLAACAQVTRTQGTSFTDPDFQGRPFASLIVEVKSNSLAEREAIERAAVANLQAAGIKAWAAIDVVPPTRDIGKSAERRAYMNTGADGALEIRPRGKHIEREYIPGNRYPRRVRSMGHPGYYSYEPGHYDPGFTIEEPHAKYDARLAALPKYRTMWTGEFETAGPTGMNFSQVGAHFARELVERLAHDGLIPPLPAQ